MKTETAPAAAVKSVLDHETHLIVDLRSNEIIAAYRCKRRARAVARGFTDFNGGLRFLVQPVVLH